MKLTLALYALLLVTGCLAERQQPSKEVKPKRGTDTKGTINSLPETAHENVKKQPHEALYITTPQQAAQQQIPATQQQQQVYHPQVVQYQTQQVNPQHAQGHLHQYTTVPVQYVQRPVVIPQQHQQPMMILVSQAGGVPSYVNDPTFAQAAQQLVHYYNTHPQARLQLLQNYESKYGQVPHVYHNPQQQQVQQQQQLQQSRQISQAAVNAHQHNQVYSTLPQQHISQQVQQQVPQHVQQLPQQVSQHVQQLPQQVQQHLSPQGVKYIPFDPSLYQYQGQAVINPYSGISGEIKKDPKSISLTTQDYSQGNFDKQAAQSLQKPSSVPPYAFVRQPFYRGRVQ